MGFHHLRTCPSSTNMPSRRVQMMDTLWTQRASDATMHRNNTPPLFMMKEAERERGKERERERERERGREERREVTSLSKRDRHPSGPGPSMLDDGSWLWIRRHPSGFPSTNWAQPRCAASPVHNRRLSILGAHCAEMKSFQSLFPLPPLPRRSDDDDQHEREGVQHKTGVLSAALRLQFVDPCPGTQQKRKAGGKRMKVVFYLGTSSVN
ncbi:hypothetical protein LZ30DRAFT_161582 [Colletotrichum cereale]|nr:hypothetical protein LZ30DRAFT_161582 [Colletotrichum cereale]